jgi:hypothetical protein
MRRTMRGLLAAAMLTVLAVPLSAVAIAPPGAAAASPSNVTVEPLCAPAAPGDAQCLALRRTDIAARPAWAITPMTTPSGFARADLQSAYALPGGSAGSGMTVAVVDAYDLPTAEADLAMYRTQYGLPACTTANGCFRKVDQNGGTSYPAANSGWGGEIALDIDMVSATCPYCKILLVEATTASFVNLGTAVNTAVALGAVAVSNSYSGLESSSATSYDTSYYKHPGVAITASTGDYGYDVTPVGSSLYVGVGYPAASPYVVAVGGTSLVKDGSARGWTESAWGDLANGIGAGSGCSLYEAKPSWQTDPNCSKRMQADVSAVADPYTGVAVYDSYGVSGWVVVGGTSASSPIIASVFAMARRPAADVYPASYLYADTADLYDVTSGSNDIWVTPDCTVTYFCTGVAGYDGPTGLGTPNGTAAFGPPPTVPGKPTSVTATRGNGSALVSWTAPPDNGSAIARYTVTASDGTHTCTWTTGPLSCAVSGLTNGTAYTFTVTATNGVGTGPASDPSNSVTPATEPDKPTGVTATAYNSSAFVSWTAPASNGGSAITGYTATSSPDGKTCTTSGTSCPVLGLTNGTPYTFTVVATNGVGPSPASDPSNSVPPAPVPDKPAGVTATRGNGSALVSWTAPPDNGSAITGYTVTASDGTHTCTWTSGPLSCAVSGLTNGTAYTFTATATNGVGTGPASDPSNGVTPATVPGKPTGVTATAGNASSLVSWTAPASNGGSTITGHTVTASDGTHTCTWTSGPLSCTVSGLTNDTAYTFTVTATNGVGTGPASDPSAAVTPVAPLSGATYHALTPARLLDTRNGTGLGGVFSSHVARTFQVTGGGGVPSNATAVTGNLTVTGQTSGGYLFAGPNATDNPTSSTLNFPLGDDRANALTVALGGGGTLSITYVGSAGPSSSAQVIFDVTGYFVP